jgi:outer membrane biosynthesis protein TonB
VLLDYPAPRLSLATYKIMGAGRAQKSLTGKLSIQVKSGTIDTIKVLKSTGFKAADDEIAAWIRARWQFRPGITQTFILPVNVILPTANQDKSQPKLSPADLARLNNGETHELILSIQVDHGQITKVGVLHSTGDPRLDTAAARWIRDTWVFNPDESGSYNLPVVFSKAKE